MRILFKILGQFLNFILNFIAFLIFVLLANFLISKITVNAKINNTSNPISIYIISNGVHTDIVVPVKNEIFDWSDKISSELTIAKNKNLKYLAIGWGDKGFYLNTPTWADLKFSTAFKAASGLSSSAMHCTFYQDMKESNRCKKILISKNDYVLLVKEISNSFQKINNEFIPIDTKSLYGNNDVFFEAKGSYNIFYTCNTWANSVLKSANQKAALWTIYEKGIFQHYQ